MRKRKKKFLSFALAFAMVFSQMPATALAVDTETPPVSICEHHKIHTKDCGYAEEIPGTDCNHTHTDECYKEVASCVHQHTEAICGFVAAVPASPCNFDPATCEECAKQDGEEEQAPVCAGLEGCADGAHASDCPLYEEPQPTCNCEAPCTEEAVNKDCPVCGAENADLGQCKGTPAMEELKPATPAEPACDCTDKCAEGAEKADCPVCTADLTQCKGVVSVAALAAAVPLSDTCPFTVTKQDGSPATEDSGDGQGDYTWTTDTVNKLTIKNSDLTISTKESYTAVSPASAVILVENNATTLTLAGVNITAPGFYTALSTTGALTINLAANSNNTLTGGSSDGNGIFANTLTINGPGTLQAQGTSSQHGIQIKQSVTITGGTVTATGGNSNGAGISFDGDASDKKVIISGGNVTAKGGGNSKGIGGQAAAFSTGTAGTAIIHVSSFGDYITKNESELKGIIFEGNAGKVYGDQTLGENFTIAGGETLTVPDGAKLTNNGTLTIEQNGTLTVEQGGTLVNNGTINNQGSIVNNGTIDNTNGAMTGNAPTGSGSVLPLPVTYTVTYDGNDNTSGAVPVDGTSYNSGAQVTVLGNTGNLVKDGFTFDGWNTAANGTGTAYAAGATFTISSNTILYAQWKVNDGNTGGGDTDNGGTGGNGGGSSGGSSQDNDKPTKPVQPDKPEKPVVPSVIPPNPVNPVLPEVEPVNPFHPFKPLPPTKPDTPADEEEPFIKGDDGNGNTDTGSGWTVITDQTEAAKDGDKITVDMNGATTVPGNVIESIAGKDVTVVFDMGEGILWTVNGLRVTADNIADINLNVSKNTANIPVDVINNVTGERYSMTISLEYDGEFGFTAVLTVNMEKKNAGLYANLFYYNPEAEEGNELEFMCADIIDADGNADLEFTHASDYTIVIDETSMDPELVADGDTEDGTDAAADTDAADTATADTDMTADESADDGTDGISLWVWILMIVAAVIVAGGVYVYFNGKKNADSDTLE